MPRLKGQGRWTCLCVVAVLCLATVRQLAAAPIENPSFSGGRAFEDLKRLVAFGPRPSGSSQLADARRWIISQIRETGATVVEDSFTASTPIGQLPMTNLIVKVPGSKPDVVIVAGHYDTARIPNVAFLGANDGGSSAALLMELARALAGHKNPFTVWLVFFDGEEATQQWSDSDSLYGSRHLVQRLSASGDLSRVQAMILVDMIGDADLDIHREANSSGWLSDLIFKAAKGLGYSHYFSKDPRAVDDDHIPFLNAGVSAVDLIDFDYGPRNRYWHSAEDTVQHCSAVSLTIVGRVVVAALGELANSPRLK
jgi:Zn-dependent M28 family amino/carboxypeptidase